MNSHRPAALLLNRLGKAGEYIELAWALRHLDHRPTTYHFLVIYHLGDNIRFLATLSLLKRFKNERLHEPVKRIVVFVPKSLVGLAKAYPDIDAVYGMSEAVLALLDRFARIGRRIGFNIYSGTRLAINALEKFHIDEDYFFSHANLLRIPNQLDESSVRKAQLYIDEHAIDPCRSVLLIPHARSSTSVDAGEFDAAVRHYNKLGLRVFSNTFGSKEPLPGTEAIDLPVDVLLAVVQRGLLVVGVQCGLMDAIWAMRFCDHMIRVFILEREYDHIYHAKRYFDPDNRIERVGGVVSITARTDEQRMGLGGDIEAQSDYFIKGMLQQRVARETGALGDEPRRALDMDEAAALLGDLLSREGLLIAIVASYDSKWLYLSRSLLEKAGADAGSPSLRPLALIDTDQTEAPQTKAAPQLGPFVVDAKYLMFCIEDDCGYENRWRDLFDDPLFAAELPRDTMGWLSTLETRMGTKESRFVLNGIEYLRVVDSLGVVVYSKQTASVLDSFIVYSTELPVSDAALWEIE